MEQTFKIIDEHGIHARPATALVSTAKKFTGVECSAEANGRKVTLKSILGVLSLGVETGDKITIIAEGEEEAEAEAIAALTDVMINQGLGELNA